MANAKATIQDFIKTILNIANIEYADEGLVCPKDLKPTTRLGTVILKRLWEIVDYNSHYDYSEKDALADENYSNASDDSKKKKTDPYDGLRHADNKARQFNPNNILYFINHFYHTEYKEFALVDNYLMLYIDPKEIERIQDDVKNSNYNSAYDLANEMFKDISEKKAAKKEKEKERKKQKREQEKQKEMKIQLHQENSKKDYLFKALNHYYYKINPYDWIDLQSSADTKVKNDKWFNEDENDEKDKKDAKDDKEAFIHAHQLLYLSTFTGLKYNGITNSKAVIKPPEIDDFVEFLDTHHHVILHGPPECGKTFFVKYLASQNHSSVFYTSESKIDDTTILKTMRPDYRFWVDTFPEYIKNDPTLVGTDPLKAYSGIVNPFDPERYLNTSQLLDSEIDPEDTLIIDNVTDLSVIEKYQSIPCKVIFILPSSALSLLKDDYKDSCYYYDNSSVIFELMRKHGITEQQDMDDLFSCLGFNFHVHRIVCLNFRNENKKGNAQNFLKDLLNLKSGTQETDKFLKSYSNKLSINHKGKSTGISLDGYIEFLYENQLDEKERQLLRILCKLQKQTNDHSLEQFKPFFEKYMSFTKLIETGWLTNDDLKIPEIIVASLNRNKNYSNAQFSFILELMRDIAEDGYGLFSNITPPETMMHLIDCLHNDYLDYIFYRREKADENLYNDFSKKVYSLKTNEKILCLEEYQKELNYIISLRNKGYSDETIGTASVEDPYTDIQYMRHTALQFFYYVGLHFSLKYKKLDLFDKLYNFISDSNPKQELISSNDTEWELYVQSWKSIAKNHDVSKDLMDKYKELSDGTPSLKFVDLMYLDTKINKLTALTEKIAAQCAKKIKTPNSYDEDDMLSSLYDLNFNLSLAMKHYLILLKKESKKTSMYVPHVGTLQIFYAIYSLFADNDSSLYSSLTDSDYSVAAYVTPYYAVLVCLGICYTKYNSQSPLNINQLKKKLDSFSDDIKHFHPDVTKIIEITNTILD